MLTDEEVEILNKEMEDGENYVMMLLREYPPWEVSIEKFFKHPLLLRQWEMQQQFMKAFMLKNHITTSEKEYKTGITLSPEAIEDILKTKKEPAIAFEADDFQENISLPQPEALEQGKKAMVKNCNRKYKTAPIPLSREAIKAQYGKTQKQAAAALNVSRSTLKRKCRAFRISEWKGPSSTKRKVNNSSNQSAKNGEYDGAVQDSSAINKNENTL